MEFKRAQRVGGLILEEVSTIIQREIKDPRVGFVTVTKVIVSDDLKNAKIFVSVMGDEKEKSVSFKGLNSAAGFIRKELSRRLQLRYTPELIFKLDDSIEKSAKILTILSDLNKQESYGRDN